MSPFAIIPAAAANRGLTGTDWAVLHAIGLHADKGGYAFPSMKTIALIAGVARKNIPRSTAKLERLGLLERKAERRQGARWSNTRYRILRNAVCSEDIENPNVLSSEDIQTGKCPQGRGQDVLTGEALTDHRTDSLPEKRVSVSKEGAGANVLRADDIRRCGFYVANAAGFRLCGRPAAAGGDRCPEHAAKGSG
jgi:helix-turn-helix protein